MKKKRHIRPERLLVVISAVLFVVCVAYGSFLFVDMKLHQTSNGYETVSASSFMTLGYNEDEARALSELDPELQHTITQYPVNEVNYELAVSEGMNKDNFVRCQDLMAKFSGADAHDLLTMLDKRGAEEADNIFQSDMYYIAANKDRYEKASALFYEEEYSSQAAYIRDIVEYVNCEGDLPDLEDVKDTDLSKDLLILVNKHTSYGQNQPEDLVEIKSSYGGGQIRDDVIDDLYALIDAIRSEDGLDLYVTSPYRSYDTQYDLYYSYLASYGSEWTTLHSAFPGHSEHQTGLALDVVSYPGQALSDFVGTAEAEWLAEHAHEYGFIIRYPQGEEYDTGYTYEPWHLRYVGKNTAEEIYRKGLLFDEYYAFFID